MVGNGVAHYGIITTFSRKITNIDSLALAGPGYDVASDCIFTAYTYVTVPI